MSRFGRPSLDRVQSPLFETLGLRQIDVVGLLSHNDDVNGQRPDQRENTEKE